MSAHAAMDIWIQWAHFCEGLYDWMLMRGLLVHAIHSFSPPLHTDLRQCLFSDILPNQARLDIESSECQNSSSQLLSPAEQSQIIEENVPV